MRCAFAVVFGAIVSVAACKPKTWDALCPANGVSDARSIIARADKDLQFEPSGAAVVGGRVALIGDKQTALWWWTPGKNDRELEPATSPGAFVNDPRSCCVDSTNASWGTRIKREKARETCEDHGVALGAAVPWLKGEALASTKDAIYVAGNMGFDCAENEIRMLRGDEVRPVPGLERAQVLAALGASDLRVEGFAITDDVALIGVRQMTIGDPDEGDVIMTRKVVIAERSGEELRIAHVADVAHDDASLGLSDLSVLADGRVLVSVSVEKKVDGVNHVGGVVLITQAKQPWRDRSQTTWATSVVTRFDDHKPEGLVSLSPTCVAVIFDDDEKVKKQHRKAGGGAEWASRAAFVRYLRLP